MRMVQAASSEGLAQVVEATLREDLARSDEQLAGSVPILRHLLLSEGAALFGEEIVARVRGMIDDLAHQLAVALAQAAGRPEPEALPSSAALVLATAIAANPAFLSHFHALALEWHLTMQLEARIALDPVVPPLVETHMALPEPGAAGVAMALLASQARFCQSQRRMQMPVGELPGDLFRIAVMTMHACAGEDASCEANEAERRLRAAYDEPRTRLSLLSRMLDADSARGQSLDIAKAGVALFLTAVARGAHQSRECATMALTDGQATRFALALAACGVEPTSIQAQLLAVHPDAVVPDGAVTIERDRALALLSTLGHGGAT